MQELILRIKNRFVLIILCFIVMFFIFRYCALVDGSIIRSFSSCVIYPFLRIQQVVIEPIKLWLDRRVQVRDLFDKIQCLQKERDKLFEENIALQAMRYYSDETFELRDFNKRYLLQKGRIVQVLARHFSSNNQFFLMNAGSFHGIKKDMIALYNNCIVGKVCEIYPWYCKLLLITDAECKIAVVCPRSGASGIHEGINDERHTVLRHVSHLKKVELDSMIFSSGEGLIFPNGFAVGIIETADKQDLFYSIKIRPAVDFHELSYCVLIAREEIEAMLL